MLRKKFFQLYLKGRNISRFRFMSLPKEIKLDRKCLLDIEYRVMPNLLKSSNLKSVIPVRLGVTNATFSLCR